MNIYIPQHNHTYANVKIKTASDLKYWYQLKHPEGHFFDRKTMKFFGDTMRNYGIRNFKNCVELYRKKPVKGGLQTSHYFLSESLEDKTSFPGMGMVIELS